MLYMPAASPNPPVVLQEAHQAPLQGTSRYFMVQSAPVVPAVPVLNTTYVYPRYGFVPKPVETSVTKEDIEKSQPIQLYELAQPVQHVMHHHVQANASSSSCAGYCDLCCPWTVTGHVQVSRPCTCSTNAHAHKRCSRRDQFEQDELDQVNSSTGETIDEKIARIRFELGVNVSNRACASSQTQPMVEHHIHHRPRSNSRPRSASAGREAWRSTGQNEYPWRDSHLPGYREATFARAQTPVDESRVWKETAHQRSHQNTQKPSTYYNKTGYVYHPKSESEAKKHYTQMTGKNADQEVHQALRGGTTTYKYNGSSNGHYDRHQSARYDHGAHSSVPTTTKTHSLRKIDSTQHHNLYACNEPCLHVIPKSGSASDPPYVKILNAPVTYLH